MCVSSSAVSILASVLSVTMHYKVLTVCVCVCACRFWGIHVQSNISEPTRVPALLSAAADGKSLWILASGQFVVTTATALAPSILAVMMFEKRPAF